MCRKKKIAPLQSAHLGSSKFEHTLVHFPKQPLSLPRQRSHHVMRIVYPIPLPTDHFLFQARVHWCDCMNGFVLDTHQGRRRCTRLQVCLYWSTSRIRRLCSQGRPLLQVIIRINSNHRYNHLQTQHAHEHGLELMQVPAVKSLLWEIIPRSNQLYFNGGGVNSLSSFRLWTCAGI